LQRDVLKKEAVAKVSQVSHIEHMQSDSELKGLEKGARVLFGEEILFQLSVGYTL